MTKAWNYVARTSELRVESFEVVQRKLIKELCLKLLQWKQLGPKSSLHQFDFAFFQFPVENILKWIILSTFCLTQRSEIGLFFQCFSCFFLSEWGDILCRQPSNQCQHLLRRTWQNSSIRMFACKVHVFELMETLSVSQHLIQEKLIWFGKRQVIVHLKIRRFNKN